MTTAKELAAATQAQRLAEGYRKRFEAAAMGADNADDVVCSLARTLLRPRSTPQPEPIPIPADTRDVVREALKQALDSWAGAAHAHINDALAALDELPAEGETLGYVALLDGGLDGFTCFRKGREEAERFVSDMRWKGSDNARIVRLVAEPGQ